MKKYFIGVLAASFTFSAFSALAATGMHYSKSPTYTVISQGPPPHIRSTINSAGYMRIYIQYKGDIYVMRKLRNSVNPRPILQKLDDESAAAIRRQYGDRILRMNSLDTPIIIDHPTAGTYRFEREGGKWSRVGWGGTGGGSSSGSSNGGGGGDEDEDDQDTDPVSSSGGHGGSRPVCELTRTCGGTSGGGSSSSSSSGSSSSGSSSSSSSSSSGGGSSSGGSPAPLIDLCYPSTGDATNVSTAAQLQTALNAAAPGDQIVLANGTYGGTFTYNKNGTATNPIVIRGGGGAVFTGVFNLGGSYSVLAGVKFQGGRATMNGHHNRITRTLFAEPANPAVEMTKGDNAYNRVDHNEFRTIRGMAVEINTQRNASKHQGHRIDHNYVYDHHVTGSEEVMRMLTDAYRDSYITYEYNLFDKVLQGERDESEIISVKTAKTILRGNTVINSPNTTLAFRVTNRTLAEGNYLEGGASIRVFGDDHIIRNNKISGGKIEIRGGDGTMDDRPSGCVESTFAPTKPSCTILHAAARRTLVENNIGAIQVGVSFGGDNVPAEDTILRNNSGPISLLDNQEGTTKTDGTPVNSARKLTMSDVGIGAADPECGR